MAASVLTMLMMIVCVCECVCICCGACSGGAADAIVATAAQTHTHKARGEWILRRVDSCVPARFVLACRRDAHICHSMLCYSMLCILDAADQHSLTSACFQCIFIYILGIVIFSILCVLAHTRLCCDGTTRTSARSRRDCLH